MEDGKYELSVLVDSACGGSSIQDGQLGTMLHRPMLADDGRGVGEALDEIVCVENDGEGLTTSQQEATKQRDEFKKEVSCRDMDNALMKVVALEETCSSQQDQLKNLNYQLATANEKLKTSQQETIKQRDEFKKELSCLRSELLQVRVDRDFQVAVVQSMIDKVKKFKEFSGEFSKEMDNVLMKAVALEETCSSQQDQLKNLNYQLATANEKLKELKGNIRVFCRVRHTLPEIDGRGADGTIVSYPTNVENLGHDIELMQNVFGHEASQEDVFVEISQLVQSTLDRYKPCLGGDSKTLMFVNISPEASSASESICSLQFAARVNA